MSCAGRVLAKLMSLNCGSRREPGKRRTSAMAAISCDFTKVTNSSHERLEWPTVKSVGGALEGDGTDIGGSSVIRRAMAVCGESVVGQWSPSRQSHVGVEVPVIRRTPPP